MRLMRHKALLVILSILLGMTAFADIYRWVDKDGRVHYSDKPAQDVESQHIEIEPTPNPKKPQIDTLQRPTLEEAVKESDRSKEAQRAKSSAEQSEKANRLAQEQRCIEARKQQTVLQELHLPAYRDEQGKFRAKWKYDTYQGKREYLDDAMRATAIEQAREEVAANCEHPDDAKAQELARMQWISSEHCAKHSVELEALEQPSARAVRQDLEEKRRLVKMYCEE